MQPLAGAGRPSPAARAIRPPEDAEDASCAGRVNRTDPGRRSAPRGVDAAAPRRRARDVLATEEDATARRLAHEPNDGAPGVGGSAAARRPVERFTSAYGRGDPPTAVKHARTRRAQPAGRSSDGTERLHLFDGEVRHLDARRVGWTVSSLRRSVGHSSCAVTGQLMLWCRRSGEWRQRVCRQTSMTARAHRGLKNWNLPAWARHCVAMAASARRRCHRSDRGTEASSAVHRVL